MKQPILKIVSTASGKPIDMIGARAGETVALRVEFLADWPEGEVAYVWKAVPASCVTWGEYRTEPDFKRDAVVNRHGALYVSAFDSNGFRLDSQTVKVRPASATTGDA